MARPMPVPVVVASSLGGALARPTDVLVDFTSPDSVKQRTLEALAAGVRVVIGTSGLTAADYADIERAAAANRLGVIARPLLCSRPALLHPPADAVVHLLPGQVPGGSPAIARRSAGRDRGSAADAGSRCRPAWPRAARRGPGRAAG
jgi:hypothetical protein